MHEESSPGLVLHFRNAETHRALQQAAKTLGVSVGELVEAAIEQDLAVLEGNLEPRLQRTVELLGSYRGEAERDIEDFAHAEVTVHDPLRARRARAEDAYGIGAAFARRMERG